MTKVKRLIKKKHQVLRNSFKASQEYVKIYCQNSSIHGLAYFVKAGLILLEKFVWFSIMGICFYYCITIGLTSLQKYRTKSTMIALERDYHMFRTTLPGITLCPYTRLNLENFEKYCKKNGISGEEQSDFYEFLHSMANLTYFNVEDIRVTPQIDLILDRLDIKPVNYMDLIFNMSGDLTQEPITDKRLQCTDGRHLIKTRQVLTEFGLCYICNSMLSDKYSSRYFLYGEYPVDKMADETMVDSLSGTYFDKSMDITIKGLPIESAGAYIHSAFDTMKIDQRIYYIDDSIFLVVESTEFDSDDTFQHSSTIEQRHCRFQDENYLEHFPLYTRNLCFQECRMNLVYQYCKCLPHFYPNRGPKPKPVCDYKTLKECIPHHKDYFIQMHSIGDRGHNLHTCECMKNCEDAEVIITTSRINKGYKMLASMSLMIEIQMSNWPQIRYVRRVIFTFTDLLVNVGGTAGLFLGFSVLGLVEFIYFYTVRLLFQYFGYRL